jgi:hypothetical protein
VSAPRLQRAIGLLLGANREPDEPSAREAYSVTRRALAGILGVRLTGPYLDSEPRDRIEWHQRHPAGEDRESFSGDDSARASDNRKNSKMSADLNQPAARQARLSLGALQPKSVMRFSFMASIVVAIITFAIAAVLYGALSATGSLGPLQSFLQVHMLHRPPEVSGIWFTAPRVFGCAGIFCLAEILLVTAAPTFISIIYDWQAVKLGGAVIVFRERVVLRPGQAVRTASGYFTATVTKPSASDDENIEVKFTHNAGEEYRRELQLGDTFSTSDETWQLDRVKNADQEDWKLRLTRVS